MWRLWPSALKRASVLSDCCSGVVIVLMFLSERDEDCLDAAHCHKGRDSIPEREFFRALLKVI
jgi:hypothetical protein